MGHSNEATSAVVRIAMAVALVVTVACGSDPQPERRSATRPAPRTLAPVAQEEELAAYMGQLQTYTHKMTLAADAQNAELAGFYLHESVALLGEIQEKVPEYEGIPVAVYIDRIGLPAYEPLRVALEQGGQGSEQRVSEAIDGVIGSCNLCHETSHHGFVRIGRTTSNPFMQDFGPESTP